MEFIKVKEQEYNEDQIFINNYINKTFIYLLLFGLLILFKLNSFPKNIIDKNQIKIYIKYINDCKNHKRYNRNKIIDENPYISVCIPALI